MVSTFTRKSHGRGVLGQSPNIPKRTNDWEQELADAWHDIELSGVQLPLKGIIVRALGEHEAPGTGGAVRNAFGMHLEDFCGLKLQTILKPTFFLGTEDDRLDI